MAFLVEKGSDVMFFSIEETLTRKEAATAAMLNSLGSSVMTLRPSEVCVLSAQLKDDGYVWRQAEASHQEPSSPATNNRLRIAAWFWAAGIRPRRNQVSSGTEQHIADMAFVLTVLRELGTVRFDLESFMRPSVQLLEMIDSCTQTRNTYLALPQMDVVDILADALAQVQRCHAGGGMYLTEDIEDALDSYRLEPEELGCTRDELTTWRHVRNVQIAQTKLTVCLPLGDEEWTPFLDGLLFLNVYGGLKALLTGVTLQEADMPLKRLREARERLVNWLPAALANPRDHLTTVEELRRFEQTVFPMIDQVIERETADGSHLKLVAN